jgi:hypothetical protein
MVSFLLAPLLLVAAHPGSFGTPVDYWVNPAGSVIVEIAMCDETALCGHVRWSSDKAAADARAQGADPLRGTGLLHQFVPAGEGRWK